MAPVRIVFILICMSFVAACGGGGGGTPPVTLPNPPATSSASFAAAQQLLSRHANPVTYSNLSSIPTSGSATFTGNAYGTLSNTSDAISDSLIGDLTLTSSFSTTSANFSGTITNFIDDNEDALTGSLSLVSGSLNRAGNPSTDATVEITVQGTLTDAQSNQLTISGLLEGDFIGGGTTAIGGEFLGTVSSGAASQEINGGFIADR